MPHSGMYPCGRDDVKRNCEREDENDRDDTTGGREMLLALGKLERLDTDIGLVLLYLIDDDDLKEDDGT